MRRTDLSRRELLRLGALALPGAGLAATQPAAALDAIAATVPRPAVADGTAIGFVRNGRRQIALTFDDLWSQYHTLRIGRECARLGIRATFFPTGIAMLNNIERPMSGYENLYPRLRDMGHEFGTHLFTHDVLRDLSFDELVQREMNPALDVMRRALGNNYVPVAIRPPYGILSDAIRQLSVHYNIPLVLWHVDTRDTLCAADRYKSPLVCCSEMLAILREQLAPGSIVLMHAIAPSSLAIEPIHELLRRRYLQAVSLSTLLS